ncbi:BlaI/MecI/CopY family transcriptional regulator [Tenacibaculum aiptasiae]|uniref:BlaI/MecI/CopY family transcriptional regulator n=1 Tax=Tenacibaculum aiptasiae TaxID=426481 RepID=A0A7J5APH5_9FLAO|nr:BlaI/MecI/CopY family transcriptional regulator [Tenacibaculum aiptasiae]KAB1159457.1 BlaI/MecI/CopY family transcriptional regulator [Tenacibaculum aiptasiae]
MQLTNTEEKLMHYLWKREKALLKELLNDFPDPKPAKTTIATLLKRMTEKGIINYHLLGSKREYYPLIAKKEYSSSSVSKLIKNFFNNSAVQLASFCTTENNMTEEELKELRSIIDKQLQNKSK